MQTRTILQAGILASAVLGGPVHAADWSSEVGVVTDYRYRGVSLSDNKPALQASVDVELDSGLHGELWTSTIMNSGTGKIELDASAGYGFSLSDTVTLDLSATYYAYPSHAGANALEFTTSLEASQGPVTASLSASLAPAQKGARDEQGVKRSNAYAVAGLSYALKNLPVTARASVGYERGPWDMTDDGGKVDWSIGADFELRYVRISLEGVGTSAAGDALLGSLFLTY